MDANTITAICATCIAVASLAVSVSEGRATRSHNRRSVRPILEIRFERRTDGETGVKLVNTGLGPAIVTTTTVTLDGEVLGPWDEPTVNALRRSLKVRPRATTLRRSMAIPAGYEKFLMHLDGYDPERDVWFWDLIRRRLLIEIQYESLYGGEQFRATSDAPYDDQISPEPQR